MVKEYDRIDLVNNRVLQHSPYLHDIGLLNGKMGISIYLFHLSEKTANPIYREHAEILIDDVYQGIGNSNVPLDFENGLAGIAWGFEHLVQNNFLEADTDEILIDLDDKIYQYITHHSTRAANFQNGLLGYGFYLLFRLKDKDLKKAAGRNFLLKRLMIFLINHLYEAIEEEEEQFAAPVAFQATWSLPLLLIFLGETQKLNIYNTKIGHIIKRLTPVVLSTFPVMNCHRLSLFLGIERVAHQLNLPSWLEYADFLKQNIKVDQIPAEFSDKNITAAQGMAGMGLIIQIFSTQRNKEQYIELLSKITSRIEQSTLWENIQNKERILGKDLGMLYGLSGIGQYFLYEAKHYSH